ncbi:MULTISPECIES: transcription termination/antitermination protein NusG [Methylorubrum]|uniref:transcription termination/antitermination protein NusG n=1 Tax=Methylorubrum TaxID=2282523 RepID=UPI0020A18B44|nr:MULTISPECIES: transcription termination/antitermination NusG family protein [Methylorubrum]MCP1550688.1 transcriptional antiterminator NusG [Methylorubrum zatmanii]MCP1552699.1 transcriptional antiterminator NusG [Methylorubrum extorquens]MCP1580991.1 transcriptional antiterminator NusG [Methylorubrum extorquens]
MSRSRGKRQHIRFGERRIIDPARAWFVAATWDIGAPTYEAQGEPDRQAEAALREVGLDVWMPVYESTIVRRGRKIDTVLHLFPGYLFVGVGTVPGERDAKTGQAILKADEDDLHRLRRCQAVAAILGVEKPLRIPHGVMQAIADAFSGDVKSERMQAAALYRVGETMRVADGPFASFYAMVTELLQSGHILAEVSIFGRATPVQFEPHQLAPA